MTVRPLDVVAMGLRAVVTAVAVAMALAFVTAVIPTVAGAQASAAQDAPLLNRADTVRLQLPASPTLVLVEFVDFACSECRAFHEQRADSLRALMEAEAVAYVFRVYPIPRLLRGFQGAEAAFCAGGVGGRPGFEAMQRLLFQRQQEWATTLDPEPLLRGYAREIGLPDAFDDCIRRDATWPLIASDMRQAAQLGIPGTPTFVLTRPGEDTPIDSFYGNQPMSRFQEAMERARGND